MKAVDRLTPDSGAALFFDALVEAGSRVDQGQERCHVCHRHARVRRRAEHSAMDKEWAKLQKQIVQHAITVHFVMLTPAAKVSAPFRALSDGGRPCDDEAQRRSLREHRRQHPIANADAGVRAADRGEQRPADAPVPGDLRVSGRKGSADGAEVLGRPLAAAHRRDRCCRSTGTCRSAARSSRGSLPAAKGSVIRTRNRIRNSESPKLYSNMPAASIDTTAASATAVSDRLPERKSRTRSTTNNATNRQPRGERGQAALGGHLHRHVVQVRVDRFDRVGIPIFLIERLHHVGADAERAGGLGSCAGLRAASPGGRGWSDPSDRKSTRNAS